MGSSRHTVMLLARYGRTLFPSSIMTQRGFVNSRLTSLSGLRTYSDQTDTPKNEEDSIEFPKPPVSPLKHFKMCVSSLTRFTQAFIKTDSDPLSTIEPLSTAVTSVLTFVTERLSQDDYEAVQDHFTPKCFEEVSSRVSSLPNDDKKLLFFDEKRSPSILTHLYPWDCRDIYYDNRTMTAITFCGFQVLLSHQIVWGITILMPEHGGSSEEWKISRLHFDIHKTF